MKQFVTGGAGFIGSNYVRHILETTEDSVVIYDALTYAGRKKTIETLLDSQRVKFVHGDICDMGLVVESMRGCDSMVHFAAESHVDRSIELSDEFVRSNCLGTDSVMNAARHVGLERIVHIGTDEVYGSVSTGSSRESDPLEPRSPYSASKAGSDLIALSHHHTHGLPVMVTRCTNNFGPYQFPEKAIPLFITNLFQNKKIPLYGDGLNERDWIHVRDHCAAVYKVLVYGDVGEIYNIGAGNETKNIDIVHMILEMLSLKPDNHIEYVADRKGHDRRYSVSTAKIKSLGWSKKYDLYEALEETMVWYRINRWWWEPLKQ